MMDPLRKCWVGAVLGGWVFCMGVHTVFGECVTVLTSPPTPSSNMYCSGGWVLTNRMDLPYINSQFHIVSSVDREEMQYLCCSPGTDTDEVHWVGGQISRTEGRVHSMSAGNLTTRILSPYHVQVSGQQSHRSVFSVGTTTNDMLVRSYPGSGFYLFPWNETDVEISIQCVASHSQESHGYGVNELDVIYFGAGINNSPWGYSDHISGDHRFWVGGGVSNFSYTTNFVTNLSKTFHLPEGGIYQFSMGMDSYMDRTIWPTVRHTSQLDFSVVMDIQTQIPVFFEDWTVTPPILDFGKMTVGETRTNSFTIQNQSVCQALTGTVAIYSWPYAVVGSTEFRVEPGQTAEIPVKCAPGWRGEMCGSAEFIANGGIRHAGLTAALPLEVTPQQWNFGSVPVGAHPSISFGFQNLTCSNLAGTATLAGNGEFEVLAGASFSLDPGQWGQAKIGFHPVAVGTYTGNLTIALGDESVVIPLSGQAQETTGDLQANFLATPTNGYESIRVSFSDISSGPITSRSWDFGDGGSLVTTETEISHSFLAQGQYTVCLTVTSLEDSDTLCRTNLITVLPCSDTFAISPSSASYGGNLGSGTIGVNAGSDCEWEAASHAPWLTLNLAGGTGPGLVGYTAQANTNCLPRSGSATIAGHEFTVHQGPGSGDVQFLPLSGSINAAGGVNSFMVIAGEGCTWNAYSTNEWIQITSGSHGEASEEVSYIADSNESNCSNRMGSIWVNDQAFQVVQEAGTGSYALNPSHRLSLASGGYGMVVVTAGTGCQWTASSDSAWLHAGGAGTGNGSVYYLVDANMGDARVGHITIATETLTVTQNAGPPERSACGVFPVVFGDLKVQAHSAAGDGTNFLIAIRGGEGHSGLIMVQRVSPIGDLIGPPISLGRTGGVPDIAFDGTNCLVVWPDDGIGYPNDQIYGQFVSLFGELIGTPFPISTSPGVKDFNSTRPLAFDGTWYLVAWQYASDDEAPPDIYGRWVDPVAGPQDNEFGICTNIGEQSTPVVAARYTNVLAAWWNRTAASPEPWEVAGRFLTRSDEMTDILTISQTNSLDANPFDAVFNGTNYLVVWSRNLAADPTNHLYGRFLSPTGSFTGSEFPIGTGTVNQVFPMAAFDGANHLVGWSDGNGNIRFLYLTTTGQAMGREFNVFEPGQGNYPPLYGSVVSTGRRFLSVSTMGPEFDASSDVFGAFIPGSVEPAWLAISNQAARLELTGVPGQDYLFQWTSDLLLPDAWSDWFTTNAGNGAVDLIETNPLGQVYYRAIQGPEP